MANYRSPFKYLPDEHMRLVGIIAFHWETLDLSLQRAIADAMDLSLNQVGLLTTNLSFGAKMDLLRSFARSFQTEDQALWKEFTQVLDGVHKANELRNKYVHALWSEGQSPELPKRSAVHVRGGRFTKVDDPTPIEELEEAAQAIITAGGEFTLFFQQFGLMLDPPAQQGATT